MVLKSADAVGELKSIPGQNLYSRDAGNFDVFHSNATPPAFFVFYGEYNKMIEARNARNSIPPFLRSHKAYVLSVGEGMRKVKQD